MKKTNAARDATCSRLTDEITFQAGLLAIHAAIVSAGTELKNPPEEFGAAPHFDGPHPGLVECARRPAGGTESSEVRSQLNRPDPRGF